MRTLLGTKYFCNRQVSITLWGTGIRDKWCKQICDYSMKVKGKVLFKGTDFCPSPFHKLTTKAPWVDLAGWMTLKEGDTDQEYFKDYTKEQLDWTKSELCNELEQEAYDYENKGE